MKRMKKMMALLLAMVMVLAMTLTVSAAGNTITVKKAQKDETYKIYKLLNLSVNEDKTAFTYTLSTGWDDFFKTGGAGNAYVDINDSITPNVVTWKSGKDTSSDLESFGKAAAKYVDDNSIPSLNAVTPTDDENLTFSGLDNGYYLITSTNGTLAIVDTTPTNPNPEIDEKNQDPTIEKGVEEDSAPGTFGVSNTAQIGDTIKYQTIIHAKKGAKNYVLHDQMTNGLSLVDGSIVIKVDSTTLKAKADYPADYDYEVKVGTEVPNPCVFEIIFESDFLNTITGDTNIVVTYNAILTGNAKIYTEHNINTTWLKFGDASSTANAQTNTDTFEFDIVKTDSANKLLGGAEFELYDASSGGNKINLIMISNGIYRVATTAESAAVGFTSAVINAENGKATVRGLDANTNYYLEETKEPSGYNKLSSRQEVAIVDANLKTTMSGDTWNDADGGVHITNQSGTELPSTGGIGTTIFYVLGAVLVLGAAVLLITKRRMNAEK